MNRIYSHRHIAQVALAIIAIALTASSGRAAVVANGVTVIDQAVDASSGLGTLVDITGNLELAVNLGGSDVQNPTINTVTYNSFRPTLVTDSIAGPNGVTLGSTSVTGAGSAIRNVGAGLWSTGDFLILFTRLLDNQSADQNGTVDFVLSGLDAGKTYTVQMMTGDIRNFGPVFTHSVDGVTQSGPALSGTNDGFITNFLVSGETSVALSIGKSDAIGVPPTIQGILVTSAIVPAPAALPAGLAMLTLVAARRRRRK